MGKVSGLKSDLPQKPVETDFCFPPQLTKFAGRGRRMTGCGSRRGLPCGGVAEGGRVLWDGVVEEEPANDEEG